MHAALLRERMFGRYECLYFLFWRFRRTIKILRGASETVHA